MPSQICAAMLLSVAPGFVVPSGNLGNVTACFWAQKLGLPIREVVLATNGYTTAEPSPELAGGVVPVGSYIIVTEPLGHRAAAIFPRGARTVTRSNFVVSISMAGEK